MGRNFVLLVYLALVLVVLDCSFADTKVHVKANAVLDSDSSFTRSSDETTNRSESVSNASDTNEANKYGVQLNGTKEGTKNYTNKMDDQSGFKGTDDLHKGKGDPGKVSGLDGGGEKNGSNNGLKNEEESEKKKENDETGSIPLNTPFRKEGFHGEECDPSNMCTDKEDQFVACLRVPGNDSPHLSLLIQNKGKGPLLITISTPSSVQLEKSKVQLQKNEDRKVKVSIGTGGSNNYTIILTATNGRCSLDFRDLIAQNTGKETITSSNSTYLSFSSTTLIIILFVALTLILIVASVFIQLHRRKSQGNKYQRLDMELPVSNVTKPVKETNNDWNDDWDDGWDDDADAEAPKTPSMPVTPSLSSRGLASRRLSKEGWKD